MMGGETMDYARLMFGENARRVPAWFYVQDQGDGVVMFAGASRMSTQAHPLRYGSDRTHQLIVGEIIGRPHLVMATDALRGYGVQGLLTGGHPIMLEQGERIIDLGRMAL